MTTTPATATMFDLAALCGANTTTVPAVIHNAWLAAVGSDVRARIAAYYMVANTYPVSVDAVATVLGVAA